MTGMHRPVQKATVRRADLPYRMTPDALYQRTLQQRIAIGCYRGVRRVPYGWPESQVTEVSD